MNLTTCLMLIAAGVVLTRTVSLAARINSSDWPGHPFRFAGIAAANSMLAAGALGVVLGWQHGTLLLLMGAAAKMLSERRSS